MTNPSRPTLQHLRGPFSALYFMLITWTSLHTKSTAGTDQRWAMRQSVPNCIPNPAAHPQHWHLPCPQCQDNDYVCGFALRLQRSIQWHAQLRLGSPLPWYSTWQKACGTRRYRCQINCVSWGLNSPARGSPRFCSAGLRSSTPQSRIFMRVLAVMHNAVLLAPGHDSPSFGKHKQGSTSLHPLDPAPAGHTKTALPGPTCQHQAQLLHL